MNEKDFTLIDDYFNGILPEGEAEKLRDRAVADGELAREMNLRGEMEGFLKSNPARLKMAEQMAGLGGEFFEKKAASTDGAAVVALPKKQMQVVGGGRRFWLAVAAAGALLVVAVLFLNQPKKAIEYAQFSTHEPLNLTVKGDGPVNGAELFFNKKDYPAALAELEKRAAEQPGDVQIALYRAICLIETGRTADARAILQPIADGATAWAAEGRWYLGLSFLKEGDLEKCRAVLTGLAPGENHFEAAQKIIK